MELVNSEARVMLLYCTKGEAVDILSAAEELKITGMEVEDAHFFFCAFEEFFL